MQNSVKIRFNSISAIYKMVMFMCVYGAPSVDYFEDVFTPCRILGESVYDQIKSLLIEDFLADCVSRNDQCNKN